MNNTAATMRRSVFDIAIVNLRNFYRLKISRTSLAIACLILAGIIGYIDYVTVQDFVNLALAEPFRTFTDEELINYSIRDGKMNFEPGTSQQYSHTDNVILGQVIQRATKQSMKELYDKNIFGPLGMKDTEYPVDQSIKAPVLHAFTMDRKIYEDCTYWNPFWGSSPGLPMRKVFN